MSRLCSTIVFEINILFLFTELTLLQVIDRLINEREKSIKYIKLLVRICVHSLSSVNYHIITFVIGSSR